MIPPSPVAAATLAVFISLGLVSTPATAAHHRRSTCVEVRDPGVGTYRICVPAPRRR